MVNPNYDFVFQDFLNAEKNVDSDFRRSLGLTLMIGASEAQRRIFINVGKASDEYKRLMHGLDDLRERIDEILDETGFVKKEYRLTVIEAIELCSRLIRIDQAETEARYNSLIDHLTESLCVECRDALLAA